jgi:hypothetical protein
MGFITGLFTLAFYILAPFMIMSFIFWVYWRIIKKIKPIKGNKKKKFKHGWKIKRLLWDFPKQLMYDRLTRDPDYFDEYGVHIFAGEQGCGKTISTVYMLKQYQRMYPKLKVKTNFCYEYQDGNIKHWQDVVDSENGIYGEIDVIDEVQNWFNSLQSKDFPVEMMNEITQQRKQRKCIMGTSQVFTRVSKAIREQTYLLYQPYTFFKCLTIVLKWKPVIKASDGTPDKKRFRGMFFFVHNKELRESYDTYKKIEEMVKGGFKPSSEHISAQNVTINVPKKPRSF